jgi:hypothetical protein
MNRAYMKILKNIIFFISLVFLVSCKSGEIIGMKEYKENLRNEHGLEVVIVGDKGKGGLDKSFGKKEGTEFCKKLGKRFEFKFFNR